MSKKVYNKLVRDKIPSIIEQNGDKCEIEILDNDTYLKMLKEKLIEESNEVSKALNNQDVKEELADVLEVILAIADNIDTSITDIEKIRIDKAEKRGAFKEKIILKNTTK